MKEIVKKVVVAISGGVDSSVAAALLKRQGFLVEGVFMRFWHPRMNADQKETEEGRGSENLCCSAEAEKAARAVAQKLKIPFRVLDFSREFKKEVVDYFLSEQKKGRTPNPCVVCNKKIKFGLLFQYAQKIKADFLASGHYAKVVKRMSLRGVNLRATKQSRVITAVRGIASSQTSRNDQFKIFAARDKNKDQSYFLWGLNQKKLAKIIFPLARIEKDEVYQLAKKWRLPYRREESFDLCFAPRGSESFIRKYLKMKPGEIQNLAGKVLGRHQGLAFYTVGQRKKIPLTQGPWWVVKKDEKRNILSVSNQEKDLYSKEILVEKINWLAGQAPRLPILAKVKIRYKSEAAEAQISHQSSVNSKQLKIQFQKPQFAPTPGQSAVFYGKDGEMLGGGVIKEVYPERSRRVKS